MSLRSIVLASIAVATCPMLAPSAAHMRTQDTPAAETIQLPTAWKVGERRALTIERGRREWTGDELLVERSTRLQVTLEVLERREQGFVFGWTFGAAKFLHGTPDDELRTRLLGRTLNGLRLRMSMDATGSYVALLSTEQLPDELGQRLQLAVTAETAPPTSPEEAQRIVAAARALAGSSWIDELVGEARLFALPSGARLTLAEQRTWEGSLPNPFGATPLPASCSLELRTIDRASTPALAHVEWRQILDLPRATPILLASLRELALQRGETPPEDDAQLAYESFEDAARYAYELHSGWPSRVQWSRSIDMAGARSLDELSIHSVDLPRDQPREPMPEAK